MEKNLKTIGDAIIQGTPALTSLSVDPLNENLYSSGNCVLSSDNTTLFACNQHIFPEETKAITQTFLFGSSITSEYFPKNVQEIKTNAYGGCNQLTSLTVDDDNPYLSSFNGNLIVTKDGKKTIRGRVATHQIPDTITTIGAATFSNVIIKNIEIPNSVTKIEGNSFYSSGLVSVDIPNSVTSIQSYVFFGNRNLLSAYLTSYVCPDVTTVPVVENSTFPNNANLKFYFSDETTMNSFKASSRWTIYQSKFQLI